MALTLLANSNHGPYFIFLYCFYVCFGRHRTHRRNLSFLLLLFLLIVKLTYFSEDLADFWNIVCELLSIQITNDANHK